MRALATAACPRSGEASATRTSTLVVSMRERKNEATDAMPASGSPAYARAVSPRT
jgi:hypothetical protein